MTETLTFKLDFDTLGATKAKQTAEALEDLADAAKKAEDAQKDAEKQSNEFNSALGDLQGGLDALGSGLGGSVQKIADLRQGLSAAKTVLGSTGLAIGASTLAFVALAAAAASVVKAIDNFGTAAVESSKRLKELNLLTTEQEQAIRKLEQADRARQVLIDQFNVKTATQSGLINQVKDAGTGLTSVVTDLNVKLNALSNEGMASSTLTGNILLSVLTAIAAKGRAATSEIEKMISLGETDLSEADVLLPSYGGVEAEGVNIDDPFGTSTQIPGPTPALPKPLSSASSKSGSNSEALKLVQQREAAWIKYQDTVQDVLTANDIAEQQSNKEQEDAAVALLNAKKDALVQAQADSDAAMKKTLDDNREHTQDLISMWTDFASTIGGAFGSVADVLNNVSQRQIDQVDKDIEESQTRLDALIERRDQQLMDSQEIIDQAVADGAKNRAAIAQEQLDAEQKLISDKIKAEQKMQNDLQKDKERLALKQYRVEKASALSQIAISTAVAIIQALAQLGPVAGAVAATGIGIASSAQVAAVVSTPAPQFSSGGRISADHVVIAAQPGEFVLSRQTVAAMGGDKRVSQMNRSRESARSGMQPVVLVQISDRQIEEAVSSVLSDPGSVLHKQVMSRAAKIRR